MNKTHKGIVKEGKFIPDDLASFKMAFASFEDKPCELVIKKPTRSKNRQYRYLYGVVYQLIADYTGYSTYYVDIKMKSLFYFDVVRGVKIPRNKSAAGFTTKEFTEYIDNIRKWAMEFMEIRIPEPNEVGL